MPEIKGVQMRAKDFNYNWMTAAAMLDGDHYIGAENSGNLFVCRKNNDEAVDENRISLEVRVQVTEVEQAQIGGNVNVTVCGCAQRVDAMLSMALHGWTACASKACSGLTFRQGAGVMQSTL